MLAHIRRAVSRTSKRRAKAAPVEPAPPLKSPASQLDLDVTDAATALAKAVRDYATAPDDIPATMRADYAAGIALGAFVELLAGIQANLDRNANVLMLEREGRVLHSLVVTYGLQALLTNAAQLAELQGLPPQLEVYDRAEDIATFVHDSAHCALFNTD